MLLEFHSAKLSRRIIPQGKEYISHLTSLSNLAATLQLIKDKLGKGHNLFVKSVFGEFMNVKSVVFCGGFVHHVLLRQLECDDTSVMEFDFNGVGARFDRKAFAMVTELNCGKFPFTSELNNLSYDL